MELSKITSILEEFAPLALQEDYDNAGLITGNVNMDITSALVCIDITEDVIDEAITKECNLIISHHPLIFKGLKKITGNNYIERCIIKAIKHNIALYSAHTNLDSVSKGVSFKMCEKIGINNPKILNTSASKLCKLVCYCPIGKPSVDVRTAMFEAGAGNIGNYSQCSFNSEGTGSFMGNDNSNPFVGNKNEIHFEKEQKIEVIVPRHNIKQVVSEMLKAHPYEEVAYDIINIENENPTIGFGMIGELDNEIDSETFLLSLKEIFNCKYIRHTDLKNKTIKTVAVCGGSGSFLINKAMQQKADIFITGDIKYHDYFYTENKIILADIGHYESEQFTKDIFYEIVTKKLPKFAVQFSEVNTNPINYI